MGQPGNKKTRGNIAKKGKAIPVDPKARGGETFSSTNLPDQDLETLRYLGHKYCDQCQRIVEPQSLGPREIPGGSDYVDSPNPLRRLLRLVSAQSVNSDEAWGCPYCGRNVDQLRAIQKRHLLPLHLQRREFQWRLLLGAMLAPLLIYILYVAVLPPAKVQEQVLPAAKVIEPRDPEPRANLKPPLHADAASGSSQPSPSGVTARDAQLLTRRIVEMLRKRPSLTGLPIALESHGDTVTLSGKVPSVYEAMLMYRAVEQTPGVRRVDERLEYQPPDESHPNPLIEKGRPEELEPYLTTHIRRHLGDLAHIDPVVIEADTIQIRGRLLNADDKTRVEAILHSIPILRGFRLSPTLIPFRTQAEGVKSQLADGSSVGDVSRPDSRLTTIRGPGNEPISGKSDGFGTPQFGGGDELIDGVRVKVGDPQFTLIWDTDADLDLHVIEPGGKDIYWEEPTGRQGGVLDVDNTKGFGPENVYWPIAVNRPDLAKATSTAPPGVYRWFVVYWGGFGGVAKLTHWQVRAKHDNKVTVIEGRFRSLNERSKIFSVRVD